MKLSDLPKQGQINLTWTEQEVETVVVSMYFYQNSDYISFFIDKKEVTEISIQRDGKIESISEKEAIKMLKMMSFW